MKTLKILILLISISLSAQNSPNSIKFDTKFYEGVDKWVAFPKTDSSDSYPFGIIYIDQMAGFTFEYIGNFKLENGKLVNQNTFDNKTGSVKHRLQSNTRNILILNKKQIVELKLENTSKWLTAYKTSEHLTSYKINIASFYNAVGGPEIALNILEETYKSEPEDTKLLFELSYSYNALKRYNDAKKILLTAIQKHPKDELFYKELSFTYMNTDDLEMSERTYDKFIEKAETKRYQVEMAYNLAYSFFAKKNKKKFEKWSKIVLDNSKGDSVFAKNIVLMKNELNK